jgi:hypothetical protein
MHSAGNPGSPMARLTYPGLHKAPFKFAMINPGHCEGRAYFPYAVSKDGQRFIIQSASASNLIND